MNALTPGDLWLSCGTISCSLCLCCRDTLVHVRRCFYSQVALCCEYLLGFYLLALPLVSDKWLTNPVSFPLPFLPVVVPFPLLPLCYGGGLCCHCWLNRDWCRFPSSLGCTVLCVENLWFYFSISVSAVQTVPKVGNRLIPVIAL